MNENQTFFDWEDSFKSLENITVDIYVNGKLKLTNVCLERVDFYRATSGLLNISLCAKDKIYSELIKDEETTYNLEIKLLLKFPPYTTYNEIIFNEANFVNVQSSILKNCVITNLTASKIIYKSDRESGILKEWYGCSKRIMLRTGFITTKVEKELITYKNSQRVSYKIENESYNSLERCFWVKLDNYKFKVGIVNKLNNETEYCKYTLEYREEWGVIPDKDTRKDISVFLSFVIGAKLIKLGESYFNKEFISQKEYCSLDPIDISFLYLKDKSFYSDDYRHDDTEAVIKQIPKMLKKYFELKEKYRLNEVLSTMYIKSYLEFNFISYIMYIEMFANIDGKKKNTVISESQFKKVLKKLNEVKGVSEKIKAKYNQLNTIGSGRMVKRLVSKYKIDYKRYKDVFVIRGKVVHGDSVDYEKILISSEKAKELLTILTLKKLNYSGYIRNFINGNELIFIKDMSTLQIT